MAGGGFDPSTGRNRLFLLLVLCTGIVHISSLACGSCPALLQAACCLISYPNCCPFKPGFCPAPTPVIPARGIIAQLCAGDQGCPGAFKCCGILQNSTGILYSVCTQPQLTSNGTVGIVAVG